MKYYEDREQVNKILGGDKKALLTFQKSYSGRLFNFIKHKINSQEDAEEVLQDTLLASLEAMRDYTGQSSLYTYIYGITKHKVVDFYRRKKIKQVVFSKLPQAEGLISLLLSPEQRYERKELKEKIAKCFLALKPTHQTVLKLKYIEGMTVGEIAKATAETIKSVESSLFRARRAFAKTFIAL
ncbi:sigma-70 family RNA polymerase sigma factor [Candidatus Gottesmanbacteria bacterium]|nr:sigma-70 family RNA polymerase sigma factor [Candidatus Gottesmanbacteria bacterium]